MNKTIVRRAHKAATDFYGVRQFPMKYAVIFIMFFLSACYGWEYPRLSDIQRVEAEAAVKSLSIGQLEDKTEYLNSVIEVKGVILHIVNKGGQAAISLAEHDASENYKLALNLTFGPKENEPIKSLAIGDVVIFKGILVKLPSYRKPGHLDAAIVPR